MKILEFYHKNFRKRKYFMKYAMVPQIVMMIMNIAILFEYNFQSIYSIKSSFNHILYIVLPLFIYTFSILLYYDTYKWIRKNDNYSRMFFPVVNTIMAANIIYFIVCIFDKESYLYYLITAVIQLINTVFLINYSMQDVAAFTTGIQQVILRIFIYLASISAVLSFYFCFSSVFAVWIFIVINCILLIISFSIYDSYLRNRKRYHT